MSREPVPWPNFDLLLNMKQEC